MTHFGTGNVRCCYMSLIDNVYVGVKSKSMRSINC